MDFKLFSYFRFVSHLHTGAEVSLSVVKILCLVCQSTTVQRHLVNLLTANQVRASQSKLFLLNTIREDLDKCVFCVKHSSNIICCFVLQSVSQQILIGFVDQLEINEPEDHREKDEQELGRGQYKSRHLTLIVLTQMY